MKNFLFNHVLHTLLCFCMFVSGAAIKSVAQNDNNKKDLISVTLRVKSENGPYHNAKIWDATALPVIDTNYRTNSYGEVTLKVHPQATLIVGAYMIWDENANENVPIDEYFGTQCSDYYTEVKINGRTSIDVVVKEVMTEGAYVVGYTEFVELQSVQDPQRLLNVKLQCAEIDPSQYINWWPKANIGLIATEGSVDFKFHLGKSSLDSNAPHNANELAKVENTIQSIINTPGSIVTGVRVKGKSSPEGDYNKNHALAQGRLNTALHILKGFIPLDKRLDKIQEEVTPTVATWQEVADSMRKDGLLEEVAQIEKIIAAYNTGNTSNDINNQGRQICRLPFYGLIKEKYLPKLRRVDFILDTYVNRAATLEEIREMYANGEYLDEYSYYQLYSNETDVALRHKYCKEALDKFPNSIIFQTDHAAHLIAQNRPDTTLLAQYNNVTRFKIEGVGSFKVPEETRINQVIAYIMMNDLEMANKIVETHLSNSKRPELAPLFRTKE